MKKTVHGKHRASLPTPSQCSANLSTMVMVVAVATITVVLAVVNILLARVSSPLWTGGLGWSRALHWPIAVGFHGVYFTLICCPLSLNTIPPVFQPVHECTSVGGTPGAGAPFAWQATLLVQSLRLPSQMCTARALDHHLAAGIREWPTKEPEQLH